MKALLNVLFCDDDNHFALTQAESLQRKLEVRHAITPQACFIQTLSNRDRLLQISSSKEALNWDGIFCDLGWSNRTLEGIQILNNIQMANPHIFTVLYTAQNEDEIIGQTLQWKLDFIDRVIKIGGPDYFEEMLQILHQQFERKRRTIMARIGKDALLHLFEELRQIVFHASKEEAILKLKPMSLEKSIGQYPLPVIFPEHFGVSFSQGSLASLQKWVDKMIDQIDTIQSGPNVLLRGLRLLPRDTRDSFSKLVSGPLGELQSKMLALLETSGQKLAADISIARNEIELKLRPNPQSQQSLWLEELIKNRQRFPNLSPHDLLALKKAAYIEYVLKTYGGFPQMAEERGLDLNHIYRVNRKFKQSPFVVFRYDTVQEMVGLYEEKKRNDVILTILADFHLPHILP